MAVCASTLGGVVGRSFTKTVVVVYLALAVVLALLLLVAFNVPQVIAVIAGIVVPLVLFGLVAAGLNNWSGDDI
jgi:hypothetical protein